jgi:4'-phosphopantetheinyl transferase
MWSPQPESLSLSRGEVHVWRAELAQPPELQETFLRLLDQDERARASRFHFEKHRRRFVLSRGVLRVLLGRYLEIEPERVRFAYGPYGKPALADEHGSSPLHFNASHSHELAVYAFVQDHEIGVDVEYIKADIATEEIARHFFSAYEVETLTGLPEAERAAAFFRCWTRKEAYIKAIGSGLSHPLDEFDVTLGREEPAALLRDQRDAEASSHWQMFNLELDAYAGALVVAGVSVTGVQLFDCLTP